MKINKTASNAVYQTIYQILTILTPLITSPIISRRLGPELLGTFSYSYSIISYFLLLSMLGIVNYGTRVIAQCQSNREQISRNFSDIYCIQILFSSISIILYIGYIFIVPSIQRTASIVQGLWLIASLFDINWLFFGVEDFKLTVTKNIFIKILTVICIIFFVNEDFYPLYTYIAIMAGGQLLSVLVLLPSVKKYVSFKKPCLENMKIHFKPILILFGPLVATSVFHLMDKTMLGKMGTYEELGYYYNADKLINIPLGIINGLGTVFMPRATILFNKNGKDGIKFINGTFELNILITIILSFGIAGCAQEFIPIFFGSGFERCILLLYLFIPVLIVKSTSAFFRMQYLVPNKLDKTYTIATISGAVVNFIANFILINKYGAVGAVIGTFCAELVVLIIQFMKPIHKLSWKKWIINSFIYTVIGGLTFVIMRLCSLITIHNYLKVICEILIGGLFYLIVISLFILIKKKIFKRNEN